MSWAHVSTYELPCDVEAALEQFNEALGEIEVAGFERAEVLSEVPSQSSSGKKAMTITVWESEEALQAGIAAADRLRSDDANTAGITHSTYRIYEIARIDQPPRIY